MPGTLMAGPRSVTRHLPWRMMAAPTTSMVVMQRVLSAFCGGAAREKAPGVGADTRICKRFAGGRKCAEGQVVAGSEGRGVMLIVTVKVHESLAAGMDDSQREPPRK